jgi:hypothetical protein
VITSLFGIVTVGILQNYIQKTLSKNPNIALFPTYLSFFTADRLLCFKNLVIVPKTSGFGSK